MSVTLVYYGQTVGWIQMKHGMEVGLGTGHIVLGGDRPCPFFIDTGLSGKRRCRLNLHHLSYVKPYHKSENDRDDQVVKVI